MSIVI
jgi:hypothetical protein